MKIAIFCLLCLIGLISGETCTGNDNLNTQCSHLNCDRNWHLTCLSGQCTCVENHDTSCTTKAECDAVGGWDCDIRRRHCIDGRCRCSRWGFV